MTKRIFITPRASQDIDHHFAYIAQNNPDAALRFFDAVRQTLARLAQMSGMGHLYPVVNPRLEGLRKWSVKGFEKYLIFYLTFDVKGVNSLVVNTSKSSSTDWRTVAKVITAMP
ncbi:MAG TPA: type II toxin-antitoxin system RelE/ParE family toxin [Cyanobacteria bacterium UBA8803]|nr:type II toxin-antitoxin system RelE/ParE family toxin [Cyanobacteria bacterium UBA9273]HBL57983.1 type II toxin-antitoxin system RelE/ParE family toxin [Cyanobacteria bacterium UBA8803]